MVLIRNLLKIFIKIDQKLLKNVAKMLPKRSQMGVQTAFGAGTVRNPDSRRKPRPFWSQNWSKIGQKSTKNRKNTDSKTNFEFDTIF